jgi:uncharacterized protein YrrD
MVNEPNVRKWNELRGLAVVALDTGEKLGTVEDFYFESETNAVRGFRVKTSLFNSKALPTSTISSIGRDAIITQNAEMVIDESHDSRLKTMPLGSTLLSYKVMGENGTVIGSVGNVLINTVPPNALRVVSFELSGNLGERITSHYQTFSSNDVMRYGQDVIVILDQVARSLK